MPQIKSRGNRTTNFSSMQPFLLGQLRVSSDLSGRDSSVTVGKYRPTGLVNLLWKNRQTCRRPDRRRTRLQETPNSIPFIVGQKRHIHFSERSAEPEPYRGLSGNFISELVNQGSLEFRRIRSSTTTLHNAERLRRGR